MRWKKGLWHRVHSLDARDLVGITLDEKWWKSQLEHKKIVELLDDLQKNRRTRKKFFPSRYQNLFKGM